ncbi:MAG TPA: hypothetical protein VE338_04965 [Ktedonobacterales bacterium]|jgi:ferritin-like metal-binding protein YciE|nr:hypothetical protein [Ktedonobacterales bacterium]
MEGIPGSLTSVLGLIGGAIGILTAISSVIYQRRQTLLMAAQVDKQIEIKITRDLDAPEGTIDNKLRSFLNRRLGDIRFQMRQEFGSGLQEQRTQIEELRRILEDSHIIERKDIAEDALRLLSDQKDAMDIVKASNNKLSTVEQEIQSLQQVIEDIRNGVGNQAMVRTQIRGIAEQLLRMTSQSSQE